MWKRDYLRHGIENAVRASLSDARLPRFWSGSRFDIVPPDSSRGPRQVERPFFLHRAAIGGIAETVNQRQGRVRGRGIGAACSSLPLRREHDTVVN